MQDNFPYEPGYIGELDAFSPRIAHDLERLLLQLDPSLVGTVTKQRIAYFRNNPNFRQYIVVEQLGDKPAIVATANISVLQYSYDCHVGLTNTPAFFLGSFVVDENLRGKGLATRLWDTLLEVGTSENIHRMQFTSRPSRSVAHNFYAKVGATELTPLARFKLRADGSEQVECDTPEFGLEFEFAKGLIASLNSEKDAPFVNLPTAKSILAKSSAEYFEQIVPVESHTDDTTALFSIDF